MTRREKSVHRSLRLGSSLVASLLRRADEAGESANRLAERYIDEGLRRDEHPLIGFRDGAGGRRAALAGTRLDVWQVIETLRSSDNSAAETAAYLEIPEAWVRAAARYYGAYGEEVDEFAERARAIAEREEELWRGEQAVLA
ncbi:MAG: hypothetical protein WD249_01435 [Gaiellaceae bacterium]|jgi:uncharacterized protein (DUF433 family)